MRRFVTFAPAFVVLIAACVLVFAVPAAVKRIEWARTGAAVSLARQTLEQDDILDRIDRSTRALAQAVEPSVVHVQVMGREGRRGWLSSTGAGWVFDDQGHIVTNAHVVAGARTLNVQFHDGYTAKASLVAADAYSDIAVIRVEPGDYLHVLPRASAERVDVGQRVYAFGSPLGFKFSMSEGIVSGVGRDAPGNIGLVGISNFIQTDAAINPGNSGGPLVDSRGRLVGMNVAIAAPVVGEGADERAVPSGIAFAIPLGTIEARVPQLISGGKATPGYLGVRFGAYPLFVEAEGFRGQGMPMEEIVDGGPAAKAGIEAGDVVVAVGEQATPSLDAARAAIATASPGKSINIKVVRDGKVVDRSVVLGELPDSIRANQMRAIVASRLGVTFTEMPAVGVVVSRVLEDSPAKAAGLIEGLRILKVGEKDVEDSGALLVALGDAGLLEGKTVTLSVLSAEADAQPRDVRLRMSR